MTLTSTNLFGFLKHFQIINKMSNLSRASVLVVDKSYPKAGLEVLKNKVDVKVIPYTNNEEGSLPALREHLSRNFDAIIWNTKVKLNKEMLDLAGSNLKVLSSMSSGLDHIDIPEVQRRGIKLGHTPNALDNAVADIVIGLLIAAARRFKEGVRDIDNNEWKVGVNWMLGVDIAGSTVGIVGLGGIGQATVRRLKGFDVQRFVYCGRTDKPEAKSLGVERVSFEELLKTSDFVILSCPLTAETRHMINADTLKLMKSNAVLVNVARGDIIDQDALHTALKEKWIFAAGLDVTTPEPLDKDHPLNKLPNCYILPHLGSATVKTRNDMAMVAAQNVVLALEGKPMLFPVC